MKFLIIRYNGADDFLSTDGAYSFLPFAYATAPVDMFLNKFLPGHI